MDKELQNLLDNYEQAIYGYTKPIIPSIHQIHLLLDYISRLSIQFKKQKEVFNKLKRYIDGCLESSPTEYRNATDDVLDKELKYLLKIMKEVSE